MSIYADNTAADPESDFYDISWCDGQLDPVATGTTIHTSTGDYTASQVLYPAVSPGSNVASAQRLHELAVTSTGLHWDFPIIVFPVDGNHDGTNPFTGTDITGNGETFLDTGVTPNVITVAYDVSQAKGAGIYAFDTGGNPISFPNCVLLYHELSHAYHLALNNSPFVPGQACTPAQNATDEPQAEADENVLRNQLGLCLRNVCDHGIGPPPSQTPDFCGGVSRPPCAGAPSGGGGGSHGGGGGGGGCFIVSAATGSPDSAEVRRLQQIRAHVGAISALSGQVISEILREYYRFSPEIAANLEKDEATRRAVLTIVVRPIVAWYTLVSNLGLEPADRDAVSQAAQELLDACPRYLGESRVAPVLKAIWSGGPVPEDAPQQLLALLPKIRQASRLRFVSWAVLDALVRAWTLTTRHVDVLAEVAEWLASAPVEMVVPPDDPQRLDAELGALAVFFDFQPRARQQLGARLAEAWPEAVDALKRHAFI